ncbi:MAG: glycosyltransferase [bacterium]
MQLTKEKIRVLHFLHKAELAGAEALVVNILNSINPELFQVHLCFFFQSDMCKVMNILKKSSIPVSFLDKRKGFDIRMFSRISRIIRDFKPDIVHTHMYILRYSFLPTLFNNVNIKIHTLHTLAQREVSYNARVIPYLAFRYFGFLPISVSKHVSRSVEETYGVSSPVIENGINLDHFITIKLRRNIKTSCINFINVSNFRFAKNHIFLINAFAHAVKSNKNIKLFLVGDGPLRKEIEKSIIHEKLEGHVILMGARNDVPKLLENADIYVSSSRWEGFGLSIVEAMAAGRPVIATSIAGMSDIVKDKVTGLLVSPDDISDMTKAMIYLSQNDNIRRNMGIQGRNFVVNKYDIKDTTKNYENLYKSLYYRYKAR